VVPVGKGLEPLDDYYLWCDHRAWREAAQITEVARRTRRWRRLIGAAALYSLNGDLRSCCTGCGNNPEKRREFATALEHCDMVAATLAGIKAVEKSAQRLCDGPQVDVEPAVGWISRERIPVRAVIRCSMELRRRCPGVTKLRTTLQEN